MTENPYLWLSARGEAVKTNARIIHMLVRMRAHATLRTAHILHATARTAGDPYIHMHVITLATLQPVQWCLSETTLGQAASFLNLWVLKRCLEAGNFKSALCQVSLIFLAPCYCTFYSTSPSHWKQRTHPRYLTRQISYDSSFFTATACRLEAFLGSFANQRLSTATSHTSL